MGGSGSTGRRLGCPFVHVAVGPDDEHAFFAPEPQRGHERVERGGDLVALADEGVGFAQRSGQRDAKQAPPRRATLPRGRWVRGTKGRPTTPR